MMVRLHPSCFRKIAWWEYGMRFLFGGIVSACIFFVGHALGPVAGGLFLAFPAVLPATITLVAHHDGRRAAREETRGAALGSVGLVAFGAVVWALSPRAHPAIVLAVATASWLAVSITMWRLTVAPRAAA